MILDAQQCFSVVFLLHNSDKEIDDLKQNYHIHMFHKTRKGLKHMNMKVCVFSKFFQQRKKVYTIEKYISQANHLLITD